MGQQEYPALRAGRDGGSPPQEGTRSRATFASPPPRGHRLATHMHLSAPRRPQFRAACASPPRGASRSQHSCGRSPSTGHPLASPLHRRLLERAPDHSPFPSSHPLEAAVGHSPFHPRPRRPPRLTSNVDLRALPRVLLIRANPIVRSLTPRLTHTLAYGTLAPSRPPLVPARHSSSRMRATRAPITWPVRSILHGRRKFRWPSL